MMMTKRTIALSIATAVSLFAVPVLADHKAGHTANNPDAPGQDRACLVTTAGGENGEVLSGKWLPRNAAEAQADNNTTFVGEHPITFTQEGCEGLPGTLG
jgi:hypothetical protein